jgi:hypothetical protein
MLYCIGIFLIMNVQLNFFLFGINHHKLYKYGVSRYYLLCMINNVCLDVVNTRKVNMAEERIILVPHKRMKKFLKQHTKGIVSQQAVEFCQNYCENIIEELCQRCILEHQGQNRLRKLHGLPELKKIGMTEFICLFRNVLKPKFYVIGKGKGGHYNSDTSLSEAGNEVN